MTTQLAADYLVFPDANYVLQPRLATKWAPGSAPDEWTFTIRQGVLWQDGTPFTVDDVVASFDRITDPKVGSAALSAFAGVLSNGNIEKVDDQTVKFHLDRAYGDFPALVSSFNYNSVILPKDYKEGTFTKGGIGTGPFILKTFSADQGASYVKNPKYWGGPRCPTWTRSRSSTSRTRRRSCWPSRAAPSTCSRRCPTRGRRRCSRMPTSTSARRRRASTARCRCGSTRSPGRRRRCARRWRTRSTGRASSRACWAARPSSATTTRSRPSTRDRRPPRRCRSGRRTSPRPSSCCRPPG